MKVFLKIFRYLRKNFQKQHLSSSYEEVERSEQIFYLNYLRDGMTVFDVGANVGELTLLFTRFVGLSGRVHSFEASGENFQETENHLRRGGQTERRIESSGCVGQKRNYSFEYLRRCLFEF